MAAPVVRLMFGSHVLGWADQAVVSITSFFLLVMIGRWTDPNHLGTYAIGVSVLALLIATQESLITRPYSIQLLRPAGAPAEHAFSAFSLSVLLSVAAAFVAGAAALLASAFDADRGLIEIGWALAGVTPFVLMREFARKFSFAHLAVARALLLDCAVAALMLLSLALLAWFGRLSSANALAVMGIVCGVASFGWLYLARHEFSCNLRQIVPTFWRSWQIGKWFLSGQLAIQAQGYMTPWLAMVIAGAAVTGVYVACTSIVALANPLLYGFYNVLLPKFVRTLQQKGVVALRRQACIDAALLGGMMGVFSLAVFACGEDIMRLLYRGESYAGYGPVLVVLAVAALAAAVGTPASIALAAAERARSVAGVTALTATLSLVLIAALLLNWGLFGAAYGVLAVEIVGSISRWMAFLLLVPNAASADEKSNQGSCPVLTLAKSRETYSPAEEAPEPRSESGHILLRVFEMLERAGIPYCVLHGYEDFSADIKSDVDCIIGANTPAHDLLVLFHRNRHCIRAEVVRCMGHFFVLAGRNADGSPCFLALDFATDCDVNGLLLYGGGEILATRRRYAQCYIPTADIEFGVSMARSIAKQTLDDERARRLSKLFRQDPERCAAQVARHWTGANAKLILAAARTGDWTPVHERLADLHGELHRRAISRRPMRFFANKVRGLLGRAKRLLWPDGVSVVFLGPDGAGKSSVIDAIGPKLADIFADWTCCGFAPGLLHFLHRDKRSSSEPHELPPRSLAVSLVRLAYWFAYHALGFVTLRLALARSTLVLYDRHFVDILVDQQRYRYGGPVRLLRLLWRFIPKPDLIVLLDAPPDILQARKQEVPFEVTTHQRKAYLALVRTLSNGRIVDASVSRARVANTISEIILRWIAERIVRRHIPLEPF